MDCNSKVPITFGSTITKIRIIHPATHCDHVPYWSSRELCKN